MVSGKLQVQQDWSEYQDKFDEEFFNYIVSVVNYLTENFGQGEVKDPNTLSLMLDELCANYESFATWLAKKRGDIDRLTTEYDVQFAQLYVDYKKGGETNETARMLCKAAMADKKQEINEVKRVWYMVEALKKSLAHYIDTTRSQLSYEKQQQQYHGGNG